MAPWGEIIDAANNAIGSVASGWIGSAMGKKQMKMGRKMQEEARALSAQYQRPELQTPQAIQQMMEMSRGMQYEQMPGMTTMQNQISKATAGGVGAMERRATGAEGFGGIADLYASQMDQQANLGVQNAQMQRQAKEGYLGDLQGLGEWQQQAWEWNKADPYLMAQQKAAQLETMGRQGEWEGLKNKYGSWATAASGFAENSEGQGAAVFGGGMDSFGGGDSGGSGGYSGSGPF